MKKKFKVNRDKGISANKKTTLKSAMREAKGRPSKGFLLSTKLELRKIEWPDKKTVFKSSAIILFLVFFFTIFVAVTDSIFVKLFIILKGL